MAKTIKEKVKEVLTPKAKVAPKKVEVAAPSAFDPSIPESKQRHLR